MPHCSVEPPKLAPTGWARVPFALLIALVASLLNFAAWAWWSAPVSAPDVAARVAGLSFTPFQRNDDPVASRFPSAAHIDADLDKAAKLTARIRTYTSAQFEQLPAIAARHNLQVTAGVWLNANPADNAAELVAATRAQQNHKNLTRLIVGNETVTKQVLGLQDLIKYLKAARARVSVPVSTAEPWHIWLANPELAQHVDFITLHLLPYWEGIHRDNAVGHALFQFDAVQTRFPGKQIVIGEVGWPSDGDSIGQAVASPANQAAFVREFLATAEKRKLDYFLMEANDQPWKIHEEGRAGAYWGIADAHRVPKFAFTGPVEADPYWRVKATVSSLLGFALLAVCLCRMRGMRRLAQVSFALITQLVLMGAVYLVAQPLAAYMRTTDWLMLAIFVPTLTIMMVILLAHAFEFSELFWEGSLRRKFAERPLPADAAQPFVSIHLACCNEPPDMVIATLASLHGLNYRNFEVLVIDNNTSDVTLWQPVADFVSTLPANFKFFHLPVWPGFKAGALNFALAHCRADADVIAVVDADYVIEPDWLAGLVGYFADPNVGAVQAPQAHRDWGAQVFRTMMNWEYDGFFRNGMHHRNERDAIVLHGTVALINARALRDSGAWSEWCVCEDTELGLRLIQQGLTTVYVDRVVGRGLTPDGFGAFKKQRRRWAQGGMQILKAHAAALLKGQAHPTAGASTVRLSLGQRYHFLAGWLPWVGDALHWVFAMAAIAFTLSAIAFPATVTLPTALFMLPLATFVAAKLVVGPLLYWRRVPCSMLNIAGASLAGMGVSHAIARGVFAGLLGGKARFEITAKGQNQAAIKAWACMAEEAVMLGALLGVAVLLVALAPVAGTTAVSGESVKNLRLWTAMLLLQALPYAAALVCAWLSAKPDRQAVFTVKVQPEA